MEEKENKVTEPVVEPTKTEETKFYTQDDLNNIVAKESKKAIEKMLKDLGVEDVKSAKEGLKKFNEIQEAQKTDLQKALERAELAEQKIATYESEKKEQIEITSIENILKNKSIDTNYAKTIKKLIGQVDEINEELVVKVIEEELPMLINDNEKIGIDKPQDKIPESSAKNYLNNKYKNNPYYKG